MSRTIFRFSALDAISVSLAMVQISVNLAGVLLFRELSIWAVMLLVVASTWLMFMNVNGLAHTLTHNGVFRSRWADALAGVFNSLALGIPQSVYFVHHLNHHAGNSDRRRRDGRTRDWSSVYRYSRTTDPEPIIKYALLSMLRIHPALVLKQVRRAHRLQNFLVESSVLLAWLSLLASIDARAFLLFYVPAFYFGWVISSADAYYKHWGVNPDDRFANSVSSYGRVYNLLTLNTGYHQEHHLRPTAHWTELPAVRRELESQMQAHHRRVIRGPHLTSFLERPTRPLY